MKPKLTPADLDAIDARIATRLLLALPPSPARSVPADLDLEGRVISSFWDSAPSAPMPPWFRVAFFWSDANRAVFTAVSEIRQARLVPTPQLVARAVAAAGIYAPALEAYAAQLRDSPAVVPIEQACRRLRTLFLRREALLAVRRVVLELEHGEDVAELADSLRAAARDLDLSGGEP